MKLPRLNRASLASEVLLVLMIWLTSLAEAQSPPKKYALLIGINNYRSTFEGIPTLRFAVADARALKEILEQRGYDEVVALLNDDAEREEILGELNRFAYTLRKEDSFLLFFAGHGVRNQEINGKTYWLTYDAQLRAIDINGIRLEHLMDYVRDIKAARKLILLDHCFSGDIVASGFASDTAARGAAPMADSALRLPPSPPIAANTRGGSGDLNISRNVVPLTEFSQQIQSRSAGMVVIAAAHNEALESEQIGHGVFTAALLNAMNSRKADTINKNALLSIEELKTYLSTEVPRLSMQVANYNQQVSEFTQGVDLRDWNIAQNLPVDDVEEAEQKKENYITVLDSWGFKGWISPQTKTLCRVLLTDWLNKLKTGQMLEENNQRIVDDIRAHIELQNMPEVLRAQDLEQVIRNLPG